MRKYQCNACKIRICTAEYQDGSGIPFKCTGISDMYHKPQWEEIEPTGLTARLNKNIEKGKKMNEWKCERCGKDDPCLLQLDVPVTPHYCPFNKTEQDWQKVEEQKTVTDCNQLPDWCKVGEYGYAYDSGYFKIVEIIDCGKHIKVDWVKDGVQGFVFGHNIKCKKQARLRPYNAEEMLGLVGKVLHGKDFDFSALILYAESTDNTIETLHYSYDAEELARNCTIDGKPCGVLEHLENGVWVR